MRCESCGKEINFLSVDVFNYDGSDSFQEYPFVEDEETGAVSFDTSSDWTGYALSEEEMMDTIECPHCHTFPFESDEIQVYEIVRVVCFKNDDAVDVVEEKTESSVQKIREEALKEFAEALKRKATATHKSVDDAYLYEVSNDFIDSVLEELVGD